MEQLLVCLCDIRICIMLYVYYVSYVYTYMRQYVMCIYVYV